MAVPSFRIFAKKFDPGLRTTIDLFFPTTPGR
jgi:hypothetical protein